MLAWRTYQSCITLQLDGDLTDVERRKFRIWLIGLSVTSVGLELLWKLPLPSFLGNALTLIFLIVAWRVGARFYDKS